MRVRSKLRDSFARASIAGLLLVVMASAGCSGSNYSNYVDNQRKQDTAIQQLEQCYPDSPRIRAIIADQRKYDTDPSDLQFLIANGIRLELSADALPDGATIQLFKDHWQINPLLEESTQSWAVYKAVNYAKAQVRDGLAWGGGESFAIVDAQLSSVGPATLAGSHNSKSHSPTMRP